MRDLLHRCDSVRRHGYTSAASGNAWRFLAVVSSAVRSQLRCLGRLYADGVSADFGIIAARACSTRAFIGFTARTAATPHLSAAPEISTNSKCRRTLRQGSRFNYETTSHHLWCGTLDGCFDLFCCSDSSQGDKESPERADDHPFGENRHGSVQEQA